jgi:hypothetical protein
MRKFLFICVSFVMLSCNNEQQQKPAEQSAGTNDTVVVAAKIESEQKKEVAQLPIVDTGQTWFRVRITKNDSLYMDYEGSWPVFLRSGNSATLQLSKSKKIMSITEILTIYMNGVDSGRAPIFLSSREKGTASMIISPVVDGAYGLPIAPTEGFLNIKKSAESIVSGDFEGKGIDGKDVYEFKGYFLNTKINPERI